MINDRMSYAEIAQYESERAALKARYSPLLEGLDPTSPEYGRVWDECLAALRDLAARYRMPGGIQEPA